MYGIIMGFNGIIMGNYGIYDPLKNAITGNLWDYNGIVMGLYGI